MNKTPLRHRIRKISLALGLGMAVNLIGTNARAQWLVEDPAAIAKAVQEYANQAERWVQTAQQHTQVLQHYADQVAFWQQQLVKIQGINFQLFALQNQFKRIPDDYGMQDACPGVSDSLSGDITSALQTFLPNMGGDVVKQQKQLCQLIQMTKNKKYNDTVDYLQEVAAASQNLTNIQTARLTTVGQSPGALESITGDATRFQGFLGNAREDWKSNMELDDGQINMLSQMQAILSRRAMGGSPSIMGTVINAATLEAALK